MDKAEGGGDVAIVRKIRGFAGAEICVATRRYM